jgi:hypothetical protein
VEHSSSDESPISLVVGRDWFPSLQLVRGRSVGHCRFSLLGAFGGVFRAAMSLLSCPSSRAL